MIPSRRRLGAAMILIFATLCIAGMGGAPSSTDTAPMKNGANGDNEIPATVTKIDRVNGSDMGSGKPLVVTFSEPMVTPEKTDKPVAPVDAPFVLKPAVAGEGRWITDTVFAFLPEVGFRPGKSYALLLKEDLRSLDGRAVQFFFSFKTRGAKLNGVQPGDYDREKLLQTLHFDFSEPVSATAFAEHLSITDAKNKEPITIDLSNLPEKSNSFNVIAELGTQRDALLVTLREDSDSDPNPLGLNATRTVKITLNHDGGEASVKEDGKASPIRFYDPHSYESAPGRLMVEFDLSDALQQSDQKEFIRVEPDLPYAINHDATAIVFSEKLEPGMNIRVTLLPGLVDSSGYALQEERSASIVVKDYDSSVSFADTGNFLTPLFGARVGLNMVNVDMVQVSLCRQYDNNLPFMAITPDDRAREMMRNLEFKQFTISGLEHNVFERRSLNLADLTKGGKGVFWLTVTGYKKETDSNGKASFNYANQEERLVVLTDIGVVARSFPSGITVFATGIASAKPLADAEVRVYSDSNQLIAHGYTDENGEFLHKRTEPWDSQLKPAVVTVGHDNDGSADLTFLPLNHETGIYHEDTAGRPYLVQGYEACLYMPRDVYRPGEKVDFKAFVRDGEYKTPSPFPVLFRVMSPRGFEVAKGSVNLSEEGGAAFAFTLPGNAPTGSYNASLEIPGQQQSPIGVCSFSVEDFVPPRLEVGLETSQPAMFHDQKMDVAISARYLFGAPGAGLGYELGYRASAKSFNPEGFSDYSFGDNEKRFAAKTNLSYLTGELGDGGKSGVPFGAPGDWHPPALLDVRLIGSVQEDGGRWVTKTTDFVYYPTPWLLGLKHEGKTLTPGVESRFSVVALKPDGSNADCGPLNVEIFRIQNVWHTVYRNNRYVYTNDERLIKQTRLAAKSENGKAGFNFTPTRHGSYLVRISAENGSVVASRRFNAYDGEGFAGDEGGGRMGAVELSFDKTSYLPGETAKLSIKAPYPGTLFLGLERTEQLATRVLNMRESATVINIPVNKHMAPNITVTAWVIRPVKNENKEWYAHRAHGSITLDLSQKPHQLNISAATPKKALPSAPLAVPFTVTDSQGLPVEGEFSVALVDEGILSLTGFVTPDPASFFLARRSSVGESWDAFDALLRPEAKATPLLRPGGDAMAEAAAAAYQGSLSTQQVFLAAFLPTVRTDPNGQGEAVFDIPEYSGKGRLMVVGAAGDRFASGSSQLRFARDIVVESTAPRAVAPGDSFDFTVSLFALPGEDGEPLDKDAQLKISSDGPLEIDGVLERVLPLAAPKGEVGAGKSQTHNLVFAAKARDSAGIAKITASLSVPGRDDLSFAKTIEVAVRPPYPRSSASASALLKSGETESLEPKGVWIAGETTGAFSVSQSPIITALPALEYLRGYPYGCLEQTTSRAWPYLSLPEVQKVLGNDQGPDAGSVLSAAVSAIASMQTADGGFSMWPGGTNSDPWKSVYATLFLVEARSRVHVSPELLENAIAYLRLLLALPAEVSGNVKEAHSTKAFAAFVLTRAGETPLGWIQHLLEKEMLPSGHIFLAGARALHTGNPEALKALKSKNGQLTDLDEIRHGYNRTMESDLRNKSLLLYMWTLVAPLDKNTGTLCLDVAGLLNSASFYNTQEAGMAALAMGSYLKENSESGGAFKALINTPDKRAINIEDGKPLTISLPELPLEAGGKAAPASVSMKKGEAYVVYNVRGNPKEAPAAFASGLRISRVWKDAEGNEIDFSQGSVTLAKGARITAEISITADRPVSDIALSDLLPGGLEFENPRLNTAAAENDDNNHSGLFIDPREDRLLLFFDQIEKKQTRKFSYALRAVSKGVFVLPPLAADAMYAPEISAITEACVITVE